MKFLENQETNKTMLINLDNVTYVLCCEKDGSFFLVFNFIDGSDATYEFKSQRERDELLNKIKNP